MGDGVEGALIRGTRTPKSVDYLCGACERVLFEGLAPTQRVANIVVRCACGAYNDTGGAPEFN
jgi:hypothetical protein